MGTKIDHILPGEQAQPFGFDVDFGQLSVAMGADRKQVFTFGYRNFITFSSYFFFSFPGLPDNLPDIHSNSSNVDLEIQKKGRTKNPAS